MSVPCLGPNLDPVIVQLWIITVTRMHGEALASYVAVLCRHTTILWRAIGGDLPRPQSHSA